MLSHLLLLLPLLLPNTQAVPVVECPILGPSFLGNFDISSSQAWRDASESFPAAVNALFKADAIDRANSTFSIDVFSTATNASIFSYFHDSPGLHQYLTAGVVNDGTIYRLGSVSKLYTAYAILAHSGLNIFNDPVTKYLPQLAGNPTEEPLRSIVYENLTVGALAAHLGGTGGFPLETGSCLAYNLSACEPPDFLARMKAKRPVASPYHTPIYSDAGFGLLGLILANITGSSYGDALQSFGSRLGLNGTGIKAPPNDTSNAVAWWASSAESSWGFDNPITTPSGGVYSSPRDLRTVGLSILNSELLTPDETRYWMQPRSATSALTGLVGAPWEIYRLAIPVTADSNRTRVSDLYCKLGGNAGYGAVFCLSPDHGTGFSILVAGEGALSDRFFLRDLVGETLIPAAEHAAQAHAARIYPGTYGNSTHNVTLTIDDDHTGIGLTSYFYNGTQSLGAVTGITPDALQTPPKDLMIRLYPTKPLPAPTLPRGTQRVSFRAVAQSSKPDPKGQVLSGKNIFAEACDSWQTVGFWIDLDEFVIEFVDGEVHSITSVFGETTFTRRTA